MSKKYKAKNSKFRNIIFGVATVATSCVISMTAACTTDDDDTESETVSTKQDTQLLQNGNFEFFDDNDGLYYIVTSPDNWSGSANGTSSDSLSGVIKTDKTSWDKFTDPDLPTVLEDNDDLDDDDDDKVDYNGVLTDDLPYRNTHAATADSPDDDDLKYIDNPNTHLYKWDDDGNLLDADGNKVTTYTNSDDETDTTLYLDEALTQAVETSVLMIHNYVDDNNYGTEYYFTSSTTLTLEANTAGKLSVWVKTDELYFAGSTGDRTAVTDSMGAYIKVDQTVGGTSLDTFTIKNINTSGVTANNGWVQYNIYVQACDYAETTISVTLGLGESSRYLVEGYAFFDDVEFTKYNNIDDLKEANGGEEAFDKLVEKTTCDLMSTEEDKKYRTDTVTIKTNGENGVTDKVYNYYSQYYDYYINLNLSDATTSTPLIFTSANTTMGLTVDSDKYVSSKNTPTVSGATASDTTTKTYVPKELNGGINTSDDVLANLTITSGFEAAVSDIYNSTITEALKNVVNLPNAEESVSTLLMLSSEGAAYETKLSDETLFKIAPQGYKVVSFWIKTSDLKGNTAATVTVTDVDDDTNTSSFTVDSTTIDTTTINDVEDVYDGWVQCFVLVSNSLEASDTQDNTKQFEITINFGNTTIKDTAANAYYNGWAAIANMFVIDLDEETFDYITGDNIATLELTEAATVTDNYLDSEFGGGTDIKEKIVRPANYDGVNGASASVKNSVTLEISPYDDLNENEYAGLINKEYILNYKNLFSAIEALKNLTDDKEAAWNAIADQYTVQPLLIVNTVRSIAGKTDGIYNYGYIGTTSASASEDTYTALTVRVKVSGKAVAKVYLVDEDTNDAATFTLPAYTFWYDDEGNVLKGEPADDATAAEQRANIAYVLRSDGLYENDGNLFANIYNLKHQYYDEHIQYYDAQGNLVNYESLDSSTLYYTDANASAYAKHYLVTDDGDRVYYYSQGTGANAEYYYMVDGTPDTTLSVKGFNTSYATLRYDNTNAETNKTPYVFTIDTTDNGNPDLADKWVTVNFFIHTGNQSKTYRLELWSGSRDEEQTEGVEEGSYVMFDYSYTTIDEDGYTELLSYYSQAIIDDYRATIEDTEFDSNDENISYYEKLAGNKSSKYNYNARYYTYTLYDSSTYVPFNETTADDDETGYAYYYGDYDETLTYLYVDDSASASTPSMSMFIDYSTSEKEISLGTASDVDDDDDDEDETSSTTVWLLVSSICLVVALIFAILAIIFKDIFKNRKRKKSTIKNTYNYNKNKRYVKKYVKANGEAPAVTENATDSTTDTDSVEQTTETTEATETEATTENVEDTSAETDTTSDNDENSDK